MSYGRAPVSFSTPRRAGKLEVEPGA